MQNKYFVYIPKKPRKSVIKIPQPWQKRILDVLTALETNPFLGEKMHADMADRRKIVIWLYRIIYRIKEKEGIIEVLEIDHRQNMPYK